MKKNKKVEVFSEGILSRIDEVYDFIKDLNNSPEDRAEKIFYFASYKELTRLFNAREQFPLEALGKIVTLYYTWGDCEKKHLFGGLRSRYHCGDGELSLRLDNLNDLYALYKSGATDYQLAYRMHELFKDSNNFKKVFSLIIKYGKDDPKIDKGREALQHFEMFYQLFCQYEQNGIFNTVVYLKSLEKDIKAYPYAKFVIETYLNMPDSYRTAFFLELLSIDSDTFEFCANVVKEIDGKLYDKFTSKREMNASTRYNNNLITLKLLAKGIKTGVIEGQPFNVLEFIKRVPFKGEHNFHENLYYFLGKCLKEELYTIKNYIYENRLLGDKLFHALDVNELYSMRSVVDGYEITEEDNACIIGYLIKKGYPLYAKTYFYARDMYLKGMIPKTTKEELKTMQEEIAKKKILLIP